MITALARVIGCVLLVAALGVLAFEIQRQFAGWAGGPIAPTPLGLLLEALPFDPLGGLTAVLSGGVSTTLAKVPAVIALALPGLAALAMAAWMDGRKARAALPPPLPKPRAAAGDREFLPAALELLDTPPSPVSIALIWFIAIGFATALGWSYFGRLDIHAVAQGRIQPSGRSKVVQPLEPGRIIALAVENGSHVKAGDTLLELDFTETAAEREGLSGDLESATAEAARRRVAIDVSRADDLRLRPIPFTDIVSEPVRRREEAVLAADIGQLSSGRESLRAQLAEQKATVKRLKESIVAREKMLALATERSGMRETLNDRGSLSRALVIDSLQQREQMQAALVGDRGQLAETEAKMVTLEKKITEGASQFVADQSQKLAEAERKRDRLTQDLVKARTKNERTKLLSPISGTVSALAVTTIGQVVGSGQSLMTIVPDDGPIEIEAMVLNQDIGFVEAGQTAVVKIEAFPFTRFGTIDARVVKVSREAIEEREAQNLSDPSNAGRPSGAGAGAQPSRQQTLVFPATISLAQRTISIEGKEIPLSPGMAVTVEIRTGDRRALDYLFSPLREIASQTGHER